MKNKIASSRYIVILPCGSNHRPAGQDHATMKNNFCNTPVALANEIYDVRGEAGTFRAFPSNI